MEIQLKVLFIVFWLGYSSARLITNQMAESEPTYYYRNIDGEENTYVFGYDITDPVTGNRQFRNEQRYPNGTVIGSYGYVDPFGYSRVYNYIADDQGYRVIEQPPMYVHQRQEEIESNRLNNHEEPSITWFRPKKQNSS